jgi:hypothetical protein
MKYSIMHDLVNDIDWTVEYYSYEPIKLIEE